VDDRGFLLIEVVFAVAIVSVCVVMVLSTFFNVRRAITSTEDYLRAGMLLEEKMSEFDEQAFNGGIETAGEQGDFPQAGGFRWEKTAVERISPTSDLGKFKLIVSWGQDDSELSSIEVTTYLKKR